jgi:hypothetical protein
MDGTLMATTKPPKTKNMLAAVLSKPGMSALPKTAGKPKKPTTSSKPAAMKFKKPKMIPNMKLAQDKDSDGM